MQNFYFKIPSNRSFSEFDLKKYHPTLAKIIHLQRMKRISSTEREKSGCA